MPQAPSVGVTGRPDPDGDRAGPCVLHLITRWLRGGAEAKTVAELEGLGDAYDFVLVHGAAFEPSMADRVDALGVRRRVLGELRHYDPLSLPFAVRAARRVLDEVEPDLLHVHSTEAGWVGRWAAADRPDLPVVYTLHGLPFGPQRSWPLRVLVRWAERRLARRTTRFVANAAAIRDAYLDAGIGRPGQYTVIRSGVDLERIGAVEAAGDLPGAPPRVLFAGRLEPGKGLRRTVRAVQTVRSRAAGGAPAHLLVAGSGPLSADIAEDPRPWLHPLGFRDDLPAVMKACDVLCLPSDLEGTPRVVTEAMACGLPVVASDVGGIPEQVADGDSGLLVAPRDDAALVAALERLLADADLRGAMGARGRERAKAFSRDALLEATDRLYRDLLGD